MRQRLVLIGGPPGVGKTAAAECLVTSLGDAAWLDGDDVWRMSPPRVTRETTELAERNIAAVLRNYLGSGCPNVVLTWVLHRQDIVDRIVGALDGLEFKSSIFTLVCDESTLAERWRRTHGDGDDFELALRRLAQCPSIESAVIDTTGLAPEQVAETIVAGMP